MPRSIRDTGGQDQARRPREGRRGGGRPTVPHPEQLSPAKRRIAEALAALLVAHYRRQHEQGEGDRVPVA
jgi:hypothetical protein